MQSAAGWVGSTDSSWPRNWIEVMRSGGLPEGRRVDPASRWLILTRASVLPMTLTSGLIGGLLAAGHPAADWRGFSVWRGSSSPTRATT